MKKIIKISLIITAVLAIVLAFPLDVSAAPAEDGRTIFGETYTLESGHTLNGDLTIIGGVVDIENGATVNGNVFVVGGLVTIDGTIKGDLTAVGGTVNLKENAVVEGNLISPGSYISRDAGAVIQGDQFESWKFHGTEVDLPFIHQPRSVITPGIRIIPVINRIGRQIALTLLVVSLGSLLLLIMPKPVEVMTHALLSEPWYILGYGALTALVMLFGGIILTITICLIPVVILVGLAFGLAALVGWLALGYELGKRMAVNVFKSTWHPVLSAALGNLVLYLIAKGLELIPCLGGFLVFVAMLFGLGMAVVTLFGTNPYPRKEVETNQGQVVLFEGDEAEDAKDTVIPPAEKSTEENGK